MSVGAEFESIINHINGWCWFILLIPQPPSQPRCPSSLPTMEPKLAQCPSLLLKDVSLVPSRRGRRLRKGRRTRGGTHVMGGPSGVSRKRVPIFCRGSLLPFPPSSPLLTTSPNTHDNPKIHKGPNDNTANKMTTPQACRQWSRPIKKCRADRRPSRPIDDTEGQFTTQRGNQRCGGPVNSLTMRWRAQRPND